MLHLKQAILQLMALFWKNFQRNLQDGPATYNGCVPRTDRTAAVHLSVGSSIHIIIYHTNLKKFCILACSLWEKKKININTNYTAHIFKFFSPVQSLITSRSL